MEYLGAWGTLIHEKNLKSKISCKTPFKSFQLSFYFVVLLSVFLIFSLYCRTSVRMFILFAFYVNNDITERIWKERIIKPTGVEDKYTFALSSLSGDPLYTEHTQAHRQAQTINTSKDDVLFPTRTRIGGRKIPNYQ